MPVSPSFNEIALGIGIVILAVSVCIVVDYMIFPRKKEQDRRGFPVQEKKQDVRAPDERT